MGALLSVGALLASLGVTTWVLLRLPARYLTSEDRWPQWTRYPRWARGLMRSGKNAAGVVIVVIGVVLSIPGVPGPGLVTIAIGLLMIDFPGKRAFERKILGRPSVLERVNGIRRRFGAPPIEAPRSRD